MNNIFGFAEDQEKRTYGLGYKLTLIRNIDSAILSKDNATIIAKIEINSIDCYVANYTPGPEQQKIFLKEIVDKIPSEIQ